MGDPNLRLDLMQDGGDRPRDAQGLGRAGSGCRAVDQAESPVPPGRLTSAVDAPAHSALSTLFAARGRRRDQHRGVRTAPGIPGGAEHGGGQSEHWIPAPNGAADWL